MTRNSPPAVLVAIDGRAVDREMSEVTLAAAAGAINLRDARLLIADVGRAPLGPAAERLPADPARLHVHRQDADGLLHLMRQEQVSVVHTLGPDALRLAERALPAHGAVRLVHTVTGPTTGWRAASGRRAARSRVDRWFVHGARAASRVVAGGMVPGERLSQLPLLPLVQAASSSDWAGRRRRARALLDVPPGVEVVVGVGRAGQVDHQVFSAAVASLGSREILGLWLDPATSAQWALVGRRFVPVPGQALAELLPAMDVLVSLGRSFQPRNATVDAFRAGLPAIATSDDEATALAPHASRTSLIRRAEPTCLSAGLAEVLRCFPSPASSSHGVWRTYAADLSAVGQALVSGYESAVGHPFGTAKPVAVRS